MCQGRRQRAEGRRQMTEQKGGAPGPVDRFACRPPTTWTPGDDLPLRATPGLIALSGTVILFAAGQATSPSRSQPVTPPPSSAYLALLPDGPEKRRFIVDCTGCHPFDARVAFPGGAPRTLESWSERITSMHARFGRGTGFPIIADPANTDTLARWLHRHLKRAPVPVSPRDADPRVTEFAIPAPGDLPHDLIIAPDGKVVITGMFTARMYELDPASGAITTDDIPVANANPRALHIDPDGTWWVLLGGPGLVARRSPIGAWTTFDVGMYAHSIARDSSGLWVNGHFTGHPSQLAHLYAATGAVTRAEIPSATPSGVSPIPYELRTGPDGRIWMSELHGGRVIAYDPRTRAHQVFEMPVPHSGPRRLDVSRDGTVWIPLYAAGELVELDPSDGRMQRHQVPDRDALPYVARVDDARNVVWLGSGASDAVYRFDRAARTFETIPLPSRGALVRHLDVDARTGDLWVAYGASPGTIPAKVARIRAR
jgi:streptogramin lyase